MAVVVPGIGSSPDEKRHEPPVPPRVRLSLGVTGHRAAHLAFAGNSARIAAVIADILDAIDSAVATSPPAFGAGMVAPTRLHSLLADGTDRLVATMALARGYELVAPLPFGRRLNTAINAMPSNAADARALLAGDAALDPATQSHAAAIHTLSEQAKVFALADQDDFIAALYLAKLDTPGDFTKAQLFSAESSRRVALAGRVMIEQSDIVIALWDGATTAHVGGTGHTIAVALTLGAPVILVNPASPDNWRVVRGSEALATTPPIAPVAERMATITALVSAALGAGDKGGHPGVATLRKERWRPRSSRFFHAYRRIEAMFGGNGLRAWFRNLRQTYDDPDGMTAINGAQMVAAARALPGADPTLADAIGTDILRRFAWIDGISAHLSDRYRGGMTVNFILSSLAIVIGTAYLPFVSADRKWLFAVGELLLLSTILLITFLGRRRRWHGRWFETRRVAEYLRHSALMLTLGAARAPGRWPQGAETSWPEFYVRHVLRDVGLPQMVVTTAYLRAMLTQLLDHHVVNQRDYHRAKSARLSIVHNHLDQLSQRLFQLAVASVALYLVLKGASELRLVSTDLVAHLSKYFTVLGVLFPTFGAGIAGIRYFGDFERFAAISEVTFEKLALVHDRILLLAGAPDGALDYGSVADLAHATDDIVVAEIESWQAVFGGKQIAVPV